MTAKISIPLLILATIPSLAFSFMPSSIMLPPTLRHTRTQMSMSENYLTNIATQNNKASLSINSEDLNNLIFSAQPTNQTEIQVNTMYVNINKVNSFFCKRDTKSIMFMLDKELQDIYYCNDNKLYKVSDKTKITSTKMKNFVMTEMSPNIDTLIV
jgi:hypothetical protein